MSKQIGFSSKQGEVSFEPQCGEELDTGILLELGSIGSGHAATALSSVLRQPINIDVPKIHNIEPHLLTKFYNRHDAPTAGVYLQVAGKYGCDILLMFELSEAKKNRCHDDDGYLGG